MYLTPEGFAGLLSGVRAQSAPGSSFVFDVYDARTIRRAPAQFLASSEILAARGEPLRCAVDGAPRALEALGSMFGFRLRGADGKGLRVLVVVEYTV
jgi:hypothetical protein